ncbi:MAG TPA: translocation/assembly module TamB domain-containing protein, partial [Blastocatellia bacterium]
QAEFTKLDTNDLFPFIGVRNALIAGIADGRADVNWPGTELHDLSGAITAKISAETVTTPEPIAVTVDIAAAARNGVLNFAPLTLRTEATTATATGTISLTGDAGLRLKLSSTRADELQTFAYSLDISKATLDKYQPWISSDFRFEGSITGPLKDPVIDGALNASRFGLRGGMLGSLTGRVFFSPEEIRFEKGSLIADNGGSIKVAYAAPRAEEATRGRLDATIERMDLGSMLLAFGQSVKRTLVAGEVSGEAHLTGLPAAMRGVVNAELVNGTVFEQQAESVRAAVVFDRRTARLERLEARLSGGYISAAGLLDLESRDFQAQVEVGQIDLARLTEAFHVTDARITGSADANFDAAGNLKDVNRLRVEASALGRQITINERQAGALRLTAHTSPGGRVDVELITGIAGKPQPVIAGIELRQPGRPIEVKAGLKDFDFAPIVALFSPDVASSLSGAISGDLHVAGPIFDRDDNLTPDGLRGALTVNSIAVRVADSPINVETPAAVSLNGPQITLDTVRLTGRGTDLRIDGVIGLREGEGMNFALNGAVNLELLNRFTPDLSFGGSVAIQQRITGTAGAPKLTGELRLQDFSLSTRDSPVTLENGNGRIVLSDGQARLEDFAAQANDGRVQVSGTMKIERWRPSEWEFSVTADEVDVAYRGVRATANGALTLTGTPQGQTLAGAVTVPSAQYSTDFGLEELLANQGGRLEFGGFGDQRGEAGPSRFPRIGLNVRVEAPDSFVIRNDQVNTVASALLRLSGTTGRPAVSGRVTFEGGAIRFRGYRYEISSGTLDLPGGGAAPALNLQADGEISGYRVAIGFNCPLNVLELSLRSEPQLARTEILALITTGRTEAGAPGSGELARAGLGTAVSLLSEEFISKPVTREARPVLGINRFQIDPVLRPNANPAARLTIGAQLARNLSFTYSTSLASEPEQTALGEYIITNRYSAIAAFQQGGSATRQGSRDNEFTIEFRGRRRFAPGAEPAEVVVPPATVPPRSERLPQCAATTVNMPEGLGLGDRKLRELLPVMREGYSRALMRLGERNLTTHFQERGYFFAEVRARCEPANCSGPDLRVFYDVSPGERYRLDEIRITGTSRLDRDEARAQLQSREKALAGGVPFFEKLPLIGGTARGVTSNERLRSDRELIRRRMADLGFRAARVESRLAIKPDANDLIVVFDVDEGARSIIAGIAVRGNLVIPASELRAVLPAKEGETFSLTRAREGERRIRDLYAGRGYLEASSDLSVVDLPDGRAQLVYTVNEGDRIVAQEISFTGGAITHTDAIRGFIDFKPGEALTPLKLRRAQRA